MKKKILTGIIILLCIASSFSFSQVIQGTFAIRNVETGMLLRIKDANKKDGTPLVAYSPVNWKCMTWDFKHVEGQTYQLKNLFTGKTFQPESPTPAAGMGLAQQPLLDQQPNQQFEFIPADKGSYLIKLKHTELYLTPSDGQGITNAAIILAEKKRGNLQQWTIYEQHPDF